MGRRPWIAIAVAGIVGCGGGGSSTVDAPIDAPLVRECTPGQTDCTASLDTPNDPSYPVRTYVLYVPTGYSDSVPTELVIVLHGFGESGMVMVGKSGFSQKAEAEGFLVVYPDGGGTPHTWNDSITPGTSTADDIGFLRALIAKLEQQYPALDPDRIYVTGFSNGAAMTHHVAVTMPDVIAAVAPYEGSIAAQANSASPWLEQPAPIQPISIAILHERTDTHVPYDGGYLPDGGCNQPGIIVAPAETPDATLDNGHTALAFWTRPIADNCTGAPATSHAGTMHVTPSYCDCHCNVHAVDNFPVEVIDYTGCANGTEVKLISIVGGDHQWSGVTGNPVCGAEPPHTQCTDPNNPPAACVGAQPCTTFRATDAIWDFFSAHTLGH